MTITLQEIERRLEKISNERGDDEAAHSDQDHLYVDVLETIAEGASNPSQLAAIALRVRDIEFSRYCA